MPTNAKSSRMRIRTSRLVLRASLGAAALGALCASGDANAQIAGTTARPLPNVLLLVDTSGSMERMVDNSLPSQNRDAVTGLPIATAPFNACVPGTASNPNRWGMLLQALTGNLQPYYSCDVIDRSSATFKNEFKINNKPVYDGDYFLPYHRPLSGASAPTACTFAPYSLPGAAAGTGVGVGSLGSGGDPRDFPPNAFTSVYNAHLKAQYALGNPLTLPSNACTFEQAFDGQLDSARDYVRFGLMTFDNDPSAAIGVTVNLPPSGTVDTTNPFLGQWSYVKSSGNTFLSSSGSPLASGLPAGCATAIPMEVGARHAAAPPWEGRMVPFPPANGDTFDIEATNDQIQKVLLGTRPYGATPIEGMLEDARDYFIFNPEGPNGTTPDPYVNVGCRDQYIILLTDGAPNLDLRPSCEGTGGKCPFNKAASIADNLSSSVALNKKVNTYVIGFSVNGSGDAAYVNDGFPLVPTPIKSCKQWYQSLGGTPAAMRTACTPPATTAPAKGSTAAACCELNEIAYWGTAAHNVGPFFAETQADLVLSFGRVLGGVTKTATTRTLPGYAPAVSIAGVNSTASFVASFIPNARKVWSGEIDRTRSVCVGAVPTPQTPQSVTQGDSYAANLAAQSVAGKRLFISVSAQTTSGPPAVGTVVDSARTIRPYATSTPIDGIPSFGGLEVAGADDSLKSTAPNWAEALDILPNSGAYSPSCKRSRGVEPGTQLSIDIPPLSKTQCRDVMWDFATAKYGSIKPSGPWEFNVRCTGNVGNLAAGFCSVTGGGCTVSDPNACAPPTGVLGEVCVPKCSALGAIYRSSPVLVGTPNQFLRDDAYQAFAAAHSSRRPTMYVASSDGVLHAFKALATTAFDAGDFELWGFVPPAVLPKITSNYPTGQQILLDGTPAVKDTVWDRKPSDPVNANVYHTTLVAGMGAGGPGYYALNVSDPDCGGFATSPQGCLAGNFSPALNKTDAFGAKKGPHFLWQLTDIEFIAGDPAKQTRKSRDGTQLVALFGNQSGTPAITTLQVDPGDGNGIRQIGVAILPGGIDGPPVKNGTCVRAMDSGGAYSPLNFDFSDPSYPRRSTVRQWGASCANTSPVPGRGVTVVRLDTGEIIRHFGRAAQDVPKRILSKTIDTPFDSPIIGTPVVYPNIIGAVAQKAFVGDADGTIWRVDLSAPDPANWRVTLFQDLVNTGVTPTCGNAAQCALASQPISTPPVLSLDPSGGIVINAATGDQENIVVTTEKNFVYSVQEARPTIAGTPSRAIVKWYNAFQNGERVSGPMTVFDRTLYFATYTPAIPGGSLVCSEGGVPTLWGMDFFNADAGGIDKGGAPRWCKLGSVDPVTGACSLPLQQKEDPTLFDATLKGAIIPGVTIRAAQSCAQFDATPGDPSLTALTSTKFDIFFGATNSRSSGGTGTPQAARPETPLTRPLPRTTATVDAWALVVD